MNKAVLALVVLLVISACDARRNPFKKPIPHFPPSNVKTDSTSSAGEPLFVSQYLDQPELARELSRTKVCASPLCQSDPYSYSGFITVDKKYDSNMFYWFFEAQNGDKNAPVLLWLQGGPGGSSLFGLFSENGPYSVTDDLKLIPKPVTWNSKYALLYIDNPVGTGFSYTNSSAGYSENEDQVAANLHTALVQFFTIYSNYHKNDFYITGESYAGKYIPALGYYIHQKNQQNQFKINLKGLAIGDGLCDPETQVTQYAPLAFYFGLADLKQQEVMEHYQNLIIEAIRKQDWKAANDYFTNLIDGPPDYFTNITGAYDYFDIRRTMEPSYGGNYELFVNQTEIRKQLHVGDKYYMGDSIEVYNHLQTDIPKTVKPLIPTLLDNYKVMFYNGQFDFIVAPPLTEVFLRTIPWAGIPGYLQADRVIWKVNPKDEEVAGYVRTYKSITQVMVRGAGHVLPYDQPERAYDMLDRWINNKPFSI